jgi:hypothetical protein
MRRIVQRGAVLINNCSVAHCDPWMSGSLAARVPPTT